MAKTTVKLIPWIKVIGGYVERKDLIDYAKWVADFNGTPNNKYIRDFVRRYEKKKNKDLVSVRALNTFHKNIKVK